MTGGSYVTVRKRTVAIVAIVLLLIGAALAYFLMRAREGDAHEMAARPDAAATSAMVTGPLPDIVITLAADAIERAGIAVTPVSIAGSGTTFRLPGTVAPNAYRQVTVTPLVSGRVTRVLAELGARVRRGHTLAQIYSPELADAQTTYASAKAALDAHERELQRTQTLVELGSASRQELERIHAEHAAQTALVQSARAQLELLGVPRSSIDALGSGGKVTATTDVPAPIDGVVTERTANVGLNVNQATALFAVVNLSNVWIIADLYEKDFSRVRVGDEATITTAAYPEWSTRGRISYIDPQVNPETRTANVRVEVPNPRGELRLGMYVDVTVTSASSGTPVPAIPRSAVQNVGDRTVVYLANPGDSVRFTEREVRLGQTSGDQVEVASGIEPGDVVVVEGSFSLRAERERLGLRRTAPTPAAAVAIDGQKGAGGMADVHNVKVVVSDQGFEPAKIAVRAGRPVRLTFVRTSDKTCATEVVFPALDIRRSLPFNESVQIDLTPSNAGEIAFTCGMNMFKGTVVAQ